MDAISERDVVAAIGPIDDLLIREVVRTRASLSEFRHALAIVHRGSENDPVQAGRMQRLIDLLGVALDGRARGLRADAAMEEAKHRAA